MFLLLTKRFPIIGRKSNFSQYLICLFCVIIINGFFFQGSLPILISIVLVLSTPFLLFALEYAILEKKINKIISIYKKNKIVVQSVVHFPILEETIFRYFIYQYCLLFGYNSLQYILLSTFAFVIAHIFYQGASSIIKSTFSLVLNLAFIFTLNLFVTISIHIIFNFFVYLIRISSYDKYKNW
ncbi:CPBP family intramembrane metalloprotease [Enterococcus sp. BWT-B8]|uniref:CPBP family intramembrane glutamic endopeptidase n=1 Tax=Enterococcus sp. BWT-B8 TaxID=2885157 RepID=UPI00226CD028|nr:CPBP family intramembrane glutamic endopeptidase [Enterococcus sp. BWT-B8]MCB5953282.1 CPBP family intramembrane metalloprotease [Enterococcus sp. BWT-B8]